MRHLKKFGDGFRDRRSPKSKDPSPLPPNPTTSSTRLNATTTPPGKTNNNTVASTAASSTGGHGIGTAGQNQALQRAIEDHLAKIPPEEKQWFRPSAHDMTDDSVLELVRKHDQSHRDRSRLRPRTELLSRLFQGLGRFTDAIVIGIQANPDISSIIMGIARGIISIAIEFTSFFDKLAEMMDRMVDFLDPLTSYARSAKASPVVEDCLVAATSIYWISSDPLDVFSWTTLAMPFQDEFGTVEARMRHHRDVLQHAAQADILGNSFGSSQCELARQRKEISREREEFLRWLSSYPAEAIHDQVYEKKHPNTDEHVGISFIYFDYRSKELQEESSMLSAFIKQICRTGRDVPRTFLQVKQDDLPPSQLGNVDVLLKAIEHYQLHEVFLVVDALDECPKDRRPGILKSIRQIVDWVPRSKVFVTSRPEADIREAFTTGMRTPYIAIEARSVQDDIYRYVTEETCRLKQGRDGQKLHLNDPKLEDEIVTTLTTKAEGMFLWVNLQLAYLCEESGSHDDTDVREALRTLPTGLYATYERSIDQMLKYTTRWRRLALSALRWVIYANRPLTPHELQAVLTFEEKQAHDTTTQAVDMIFLLSICAYLLEVSDTDPPWFPGVVKPIHYSVQEFITTVSDPRLAGQLLNAECELDQIHSSLAITCINYLISSMTNCKPCEQEEDLDRRLENLGFMWYAACSFDAHLEQSTKQQELITLTDRLLLQPDECLASILQARAVRPYAGIDHQPNIWAGFDRYNKRVDSIMVIFSSRLYMMTEFPNSWKDKQFDPLILHAACSAGLSQAVTLLLEKGVDVNLTDDSGIRPIYFAASSGHTHVVQILLNHGAEINGQGGYYDNALQAASHNDHEKMVQILINHGAQVNTQGGWYYGNALQAASTEGHEKVVQILLEQGAEVNAQGGNYGNALQAASAYGHEKVVQMLLGQGAEVNAQGGRRGNALQAASAYGHEKVVQTLLDEGANVNTVGNYFDYDTYKRFEGTALQAASAKGHEKVVQLLLAAGATPLEPTSAAVQA
ncbi:hypothetical protein LTR70_009647 [Exophiala xenobiotica]|uniref:Nephrocystin 3-like N-terminal domain-containing protein n=1 Tax=Lithohypha guttulata TaxID=1690604 RepID=A0ABR0JXB6_9EURO|nr:hypothetical protein LTR24_009342 [Lithohypha guttulata]KAK5310238.1 hypothetical protein LTR70_009647 [Exophiala xenobiotica]